MKSTSCSPYPSTLKERTEYIWESELANERVVRDDVDGRAGTESGFGFEPKFPLSQSLHASHSGGEVPPGRMDWSCTDFWLAVETGKNRSSTTTSPCPPYPLPSELQGDTRWGKIIFYRIFIAICAGLGNGHLHSTLEMTRFIAENRVDVGISPQHLSLHRTYGSRIRRYIHIGVRKL